MGHVEKAVSTFKKGHAKIEEVEDEELDEELKQCENLSEGEVGVDSRHFVEPNSSSQSPATSPSSKIKGMHYQKAKMATLNRKENVTDIPEEQGINKF